MDIIKKYLPGPVKQNIRRILELRKTFPQIAFKMSSVIGNRFCIVCNNRVRKFRPLSFYYSEHLQKHGWKYRYDDAETMNAENYSCPFCQASDRDRLYGLYLQHYFKNFSSEGNITLVDFAPSYSLSLFIKKLIIQSRLNISYRTVDLNMENVDDNLDMEDMSRYADESVDFFICSHVLEHVFDDKQALRELYRISKPGAQGILMVPINLAIEEIDEDPLLLDPAERWRRFGQGDHVRLYSKKGFITRVKEASFTLYEYDKEYFGTKVLIRHGITPKSVLYIAEKPKRGSSV